MKIDRNSYQDAKYIFEKFLPDALTRNKVIGFLANAITYADNIDSKNWNLNLDKNGKFICFNVGQEYCIQLWHDMVLISCNREILKPILKDKNVPVIFRGYDKSIKSNIHSENIDSVNDYLDKVKNAIGCILKNSEIKDYIDLFTKSNFDFINYAIKHTSQHRRTSMKDAHSQGAVEYLFSEFDKLHKDKIYEYEVLVAREEKKLDIARKLTGEERHAVLKKSNPQPTKSKVQQTVYNRNEYVIAEVLERANGICEKCNQPAPFMRDNSNFPYLEVHHKKPLAKGGDDTIENAIALCPNCHRHAHYGKNTY